MGLDSIAVDAEQAVRMMVQQRHGKSENRIVNIKRSLRKSAVFAAVALGSVAASTIALGVEPIRDDVPSYINDPAAEIAALFDEDETDSAEASAEPLTPDASEPEAPQQEDSLRDSIEALSDRDDLNLDEPPIDPVQQATSRSIFADRRTKMVEGRFALPPIAALTTGTDEIGNGEVPKGFRGGAPSPMVTLPESGADRDLAWQWTTQHWAAANTFTHPLYFEDRMLERHGHQRFPCVQPLVSGGRFAAQAFMLPYLSAINPPCECQYTLGYYRAGNCVPALKQRAPYQRKAVAAQATAIVTGVAIVP